MAISCQYYYSELFLDLDEQASFLSVRDAQFFSVFR